MTPVYSLSGVIPKRAQFSESRDLSSCVDFALHSTNPPSPLSSYSPLATSHFPFSSRSRRSDQDRSPERAEQVEGTLFSESRHFSSCGESIAQPIAGYRRISQSSLLGGRSFSSDIKTRREAPSSRGSSRSGEQRCSKVPAEFFSVPQQRRIVVGRGFSHDKSIGAKRPTARGEVPASIPALCKNAAPSTDPPLPFTSHSPLATRHFLFIYRGAC